MGCLQSSPDSQVQAQVTNSITANSQSKQNEEKEDEKTNIALHDRMIMNISELEAFVGNKHTDAVSSLLSDNITLLFSKAPKYAKLFANCAKILEIVSNTIYYEYYAFFVVDFLFHYLRQRSSDNTLYELLQWLQPLIDKIENGEPIPRISTASIYGMEACLLIDPRCYEPQQLPAFVKQQYFGYDLSCWYVDGRRLYLDLIKKGMSIDNQDKYCQYALSIHYSEIEAYNKALYFAQKCGFIPRVEVSEFLKEIESKFEREEQRGASALQTYEENKDQFESEEHHGNVSISDFHQIAIWYALHGEYEKGLTFFDEILRWNVFRCKYVNYEYLVDQQTRLCRLEYVLKFGYDFEAVDESEKLIQTEFDQAFTFYYLPDYIRDDPIYFNELVPKQQKSADWLVLNAYEYDKKAGDKCRTHSFLFPFQNIAQKTKILSEWAEEEEYNLKWKYSLNDMLDIIDTGTKQLSADNVDIALQKKGDGDDQPLLWDTLLAVWFVLIGRHGGTPPDIVCVYKLAMLPTLFAKIKPIFAYIGKHGANDDIDDVFDIIDQLWQKNKMYNDSKGVEMYHKMIGLMVEQATRSESFGNNSDEKEEKIGHDAEKKRFEGQVKMLQFLNAAQNGWLNDSSAGIQRDEIMEQLKNRYEAKLDELGCVLTDYYNNELFADPNYDALIGEIKSPNPNDLILRQDKKQILQRCKWGPFENDKINAEKYKTELETKYGLVPAHNLSDDPINNSFKNAFVDFLLQVGGKLQIPFQKAMRDLFADTKGEFCEAPIKKFERCLQKIDYDYKDEKQPVGAHILDIVRCLVVYENIQDLSAAYSKLTANYKVCRLKNNFVRNAPVFGNYRCLMVNILFQHPSNANLKMICEVQLTVRKVYVVRLTMHKTYKLFRAILPEDDAMLF